MRRRNQCPWTNFFLATFNCSKKQNDGYKLIAKLEKHNLLLNERVVDCLLASSAAKNWEVYLGLIHSKDIQKEFLELWEEFGGRSRLDKIIQSKAGEDWTQVLKLISAVYQNKKYILGA